MMKLGIERPTHLIDLTGIAGLDAIDTGGDKLPFGALALMSRVARDHGCNQNAHRCRATIFATSH
jgi:CO/xanthine dehydrogenase FAD-binding subunit